MNYKKGETYLYTGKSFGDIKQNTIYVVEKDNADALWPLGTHYVITKRNELILLGFKHYVETLNQK